MFPMSNSDENLSSVNENEAYDNTILSPSLLTLDPSDLMNGHSSDDLFQDDDDNPFGQNTGSDDLFNLNDFDNDEEILFSSSNQQTQMRGADKDVLKDDTFHIDSKNQMEFQTEIEDENEMDISYPKRKSNNSSTSFFQPDSSISDRKQQTVKSVFFSPNLHSPSLSEDSGSGIQYHNLSRLNSSSKMQIQNNRSKFSNNVTSVFEYLTSFFRGTSRQTRRVNHNSFLNSDNLDDNDNLYEDEEIDMNDTQSHNLLQNSFTSSNPHMKKVKKLFASKSRKKLNTMEGVFIPCLLSTIGALTFLRLGWGVGEVGFVGMLCIMALCLVSVILSAFSMFAIITNGSMKSGGIYYIVSRSLGPEFGATVGIILYFASAACVAFNISGFVEDFLFVFYSNSSPSYWTTVMISSITQIVILIATLLGSNFLTRLNWLIFILLAVVLLCTYISLIFPITSYEGFNGWKWVTFKENFGFLDPTRFNTYNQFDDDNNDDTGTLSPTPSPNPSRYLIQLVGSSSGESTNYDEGTASTGVKNVTFWYVFAVIFPAFTGWTNGTSQSGDLKSTSKSIPKGTMASIMTSTFIYVFLCFLLAGSIANKILVKELNIMESVCFTKWIVILGIWVSSLSTALSGHQGAALILQAIARDDLFPFLSIFKYGSQGTNDPINGILLTWFISQLIILIGNFDLIAQLITNFYLMTYACLNVSCLTLSLIGTPNFRPTFKYFSWQSALFGTIACVFSMFLSNVYYGFVSSMLAIFLFVIIAWKAPENLNNTWGDIKQALIYHQVRKYLLYIDEKKQHPKYWRPSILLLNAPTLYHKVTNLSTITFCNLLKKGGLYIIGDIILVHKEGTPYRVEIVENKSNGHQSSNKIDSKKDSQMMLINTKPDIILMKDVEYLTNLWNRIIDKLAIKGFYEVCVGESYTEGASNLMMLSGLGGMKINTVVMPYPERLLGDGNQTTDGNIANYRFDDFQVDTLWQELMNMHTRTHSKEEQEKLIKTLAIIEQIDRKKENQDHKYNVQRNKTDASRSKRKQKLASLLKDEQEFQPQSLKLNQNDGDESFLSLSTGDHEMEEEKYPVPNHGTSIRNQIHLYHVIECFHIMQMALSMQKNFVLLRNFDGVGKLQNNFRESTTLDVWISHQDTKRLKNILSENLATNDRNSVLNENNDGSVYSSITNTLYNSYEQLRSDIHSISQDHSAGVDADDERIGEYFGTLLLQLQFAHVIANSENFQRHSSIRVMAVVEPGIDKKEVETAIKKLLLAIRIDAYIHVFTMEDKIIDESELPSSIGQNINRSSPSNLAENELSIGMDTPHYAISVLHSIIRENIDPSSSMSSYSNILFLPMPDLNGMVTTSKEYMSLVTKLSQGLPPCILCMNANKAQKLISTSI